LTPVSSDRRAVPRLFQAVAEGGPYRFLHIRVLGDIDDSRAFEPLQALLTSPEFMLGSEVVMALRKIDNARAVDHFHERLDGLPGAERDSLARTLAGNDLLNAARSLARKASASGDITTLARATVAARDALEKHRSPLGTLRSDAGPADVGATAKAKPKTQMRIPAVPSQEPACTRSAS
jgi:HEAT repeat protein